MKYLKRFNESSSMEELYGAPAERAREMVDDYFFYGYEGKKENRLDAYDSVLSDIMEIKRDSLDHREQDKHDYYVEVEKELNKLREQE